jgi:hypothetical protein
VLQGDLPAHRTPEPCLGKSRRHDADVLGQEAGGFRRTFVQAKKRLTETSFGRGGVDRSEKKLLIKAEGLESGPPEGGRFSIEGG